jgi:hypothetical protein
MDQEKYMRVLKHFLLLVPGPASRDALFMRHMILAINRVYLEVRNIYFLFISI